MDTDADGVVDKAVLMFDKEISPSDVASSFAWYNGNRTGELDTNRNSRGDSASWLIVDLSGAFTNSSAVVTSGSMSCLIHLTNFPDGNITHSVTDSTAPVLLSAILYPGISYQKTGSAPDTLVVSFSEYVRNIANDTPFEFKNGGASSSYSLTLTKLGQNGKSWTFLVENNGSVFPQQGDSVWIDPQSKTGDTLFNIQNNGNNRRVLLQVKAVNPDYKISLGPNPFNPQLSQMLSILISPSVRSNDAILFEAEVEIYDALGNLIRRINQKNESTSAELLIKWDGRNRNGRRVGKGVYMAIVRVIDINKKNITSPEKLFIGVNYPF